MFPIVLFPSRPSSLGCKVCDQVRPITSEREVHRQIGKLMTTYLFAMYETTSENVRLDASCDVF